MANTDMTHDTGAYSPANFRGDMIGSSASPRSTDGQFAKLFNVTQASDGTYRGLGFVPKHKRFHRLYNQAIGALLVMIVAPLLIAISLMLLIAQGRPIFYRGERVGQNDTLSLIHI